MSLPTTHLLHAGYSSKLLQEWQSEGCMSIAKSSLVYPLFIVENDDSKQAISAMPSQYRWGVNRLREALDEPVKNGLRSVLLFGVIDDETKKDSLASQADKLDSPVIRAIKFLKSTYPELIVITDLCLCAYTNHGHCGILNDDANRSINNEASIIRLGEIALSFAQAGADVIAPSDMMDGRIFQIKEVLRKHNLSGTVSVMSYSAKFASCFYGPFRDAAHSGMSFGDRSLYQLPIGSRSLALRAVERDIDEGADFVMVKPGMPYLDIIRDIASSNRIKHVPIAVYQVSGEYAMIVHAANAGGIDLKKSVMESLVSFRRAGATILISYFTPEVLTWL
jgi:porphobilinogen synthase